MDTTTTDASGGGTFSDILNSITNIAVAYSPNGGGSGSGGVPTPPPSPAAGSGTSHLLMYGAIALVVGVIIFKLKK